MTCAILSTFFMKSRGLQFGYPRKRVLQRVVDKQLEHSLMAVETGYKAISSYAMSCF